MIIEKVKIGIDAGSRFVKIAVPSKSQRDEFDLERIDTITFYLEYQKYDKNIVQLLSSRYKRTDLYGDVQIITTGYGKNNIDFNNSLKINEIQALAHGAVSQSGIHDFLLLDIGGQDTKVIEVCDGIVVNFEMNDKCAAGTGRYLENMADALNVDIQEVGKYYLNPAVLSSTCAIFAETEIIGKISENIKIENLLAGINKSVVNRIIPMLAHKKDKIPLLMSGGVIKSKGIQELIIQEIHREVSLLPYPQFTGAIGCCSYKEL